MADIKYTVTVNDQGAVTSIKRLDDEVTKLGKGAGAAGKESKSFGQQLTGNLIPAFTAASLAADVIRGGVRFLKDEFVASIEAAIEAERVDRALEAALMITGRAAGYSAEHFKRYAAELQRKTKYDDEAIKSAQALIIQMGIETKQVDEATRGAVGLASVYQMDLQSAARAVAQGFQGNYRQLGMLIPAIRDATTEGEKHAAMARELAKDYQRAEAEVDTFAGRLAQIKHSFDDVRENIGKVILNAEAFKEVLTLIKVVIDQFSEATNRSSGPLGVFMLVVNTVAQIIEEDLAPTLLILAKAQAKANLEAKNIADAYERGEELWIKMGWAAKVVATGIAALTKEQKELLTAQNAAFSSEIREKIETATKTLAAYIKTGEATPEGIRKMEEYIDKLRMSLEKLNLPLTESQKALAEEVRWLRMMGEVDIHMEPTVEKFKSLRETVSGAIGVTAGLTQEDKELNESFAAMRKAAGDAANGVGLILKVDLEKDLRAKEEQLRRFGDAMPTSEVKKLRAEIAKLKKEIAGAADPWEKFAETAGSALAGLDLVIQQGTANRMIAIDNEYNKRLAAINANITDEDTRQQAIAKLDDEFAAKRRKATRALGLSTKAIAISNAIISTHEAAAKAMAQGGFILGIPWSAIIEALGWIQVGLIAAQPIPLAKGGVFTRRTKLLADTGASYEIAENEPEVVAPKSMIKQAVREALGGGLVPAMAGGSFTLNGGIHVHTTRTVDGATIFRELEAQARLRGFKLGRG